MAFAPCSMLVTLQLDVVRYHLLLIFLFAQWIRGLQSCNRGDNFSKALRTNVAA